MSDETTTPADEPVVGSVELAEELVARARAEGVELVGPGGLLTDLTKTVLETALEVEMDDHLGYAKHAPEGRDKGNSLNGTRSKTVLTEVGEVEIAAPRDGDGSFDRSSSGKRQRRLQGVDEMVISLAAKGLTTGEISAHLADVLDRFGPPPQRNSTCRRGEGVTNQGRKTASALPWRHA